MSIIVFHKVAGIIPGKISGVIPGPTVFSGEGHHFIQGLGWDSWMKIIELTPADPGRLYEPSLN